MTTAEMISEVQASLGNRTDFLSPNPGYSRILNWLNWSQYELCGFHKNRILPPRRFHCLEGDKMFPTINITQYVSLGTPLDLTAVFINNGSLVVDYYKGWAISVTGYDTVGAGAEAPAGMMGQTRVIRGYDGTPSLLAHVYPEWDVAPDAYTEITLYKREYSFATDIGLDPSVTIWTIERLERVDTGAEIDQKPWVELVGSSPVSLGEPLRFARRGNSFVFDVAPNQVFYYKVYYYMFPPRLTALTPTASAVFAEFWHHVIVEGAVYFGFSKLMESTRAEDKKQEWIDMSGNKQDEFSIEAKHERRGARMKLRK